MYLVMICLYVLKKIHVDLIILWVPLPVLVLLLYVLMVIHVLMTLVILSMVVFLLLMIQTTVRRMIHVLLDNVGMVPVNSFQFNVNNSTVLQDNVKLVFVNINQLTKQLCVMMAIHVLILICVSTVNVSVFLECVKIIIHVLLILVIHFLVVFMTIMIHYHVMMVIHVLLINVLMVCV